MSLYTKYDFISSDKLGSIFQTQFDAAFAEKTKRGRTREMSNFLFSLRKLKVIPHGCMLYAGPVINAAGEPGVLIVQEVEDTFQECPHGVGIGACSICKEVSDDGKS